VKAIELRGLQPDPAVWLQTAGSKVRSFGQWAAATCAAPLVSLPVSTPLRIKPLLARVSL